VVLIWRNQMYRTLARLGLAAAGGAVALAIAAPAYAQAGTLPINDDHVPTTAQEFQPQICTGPFDDLPENVDGWHFVLPDSSGEEFESLTLVFETPEGDEVVVIIDSRDPAMPDTGPGWSGYLDDADGDFKHAYVFTEAGWTLIEGTAEVEGAEENGFFNLSDTCPGVPTTPTPTPTETPTPTPTETPTPTPTETPTYPTAPPTYPSGLPATGAPLAGVVAVGSGLVAGGLGLLAVRRRPYSVD
jgi:hypothetical protein